MPRGIPNNPKSKKGPKPGTKYNKRKGVKDAVKASAPASQPKLAADHGGVGFYFSTEKFAVLQQNIAVLTAAVGNPYVDQVFVGTELNRNVEALKDLRQKTFGPTLTEAKATTSESAAVDPVAAADEELDDDEEVAAAAPPATAPKFAPPAAVVAPTHS